MTIASASARVLAAAGMLVLLLGACSRARPPGQVGATAGLVVAGAVITGTADDQRTGWYPDQARLEPAVVGGPTFGRLWRTRLPLTTDDQVFAQPLVLGATVLVVTENNNVYAIDAESGAIKAMRALGPPFRAADVGCADVRPHIGITGTPVIDVATRTAYFLSKTYLDGTPSAVRDNAVWFAHAVDVDTLAERPGFPLRIQGVADNDAGLPFAAFYEMQRPALLLQDGVVYAAFGGHCDAGDFRGWVVGFGIDGQMKTLFATELDRKGGAGIWHSGGGLVSDGPGRLFFITGNTFHEAPDTPQAAPSGHLGQSVVRLERQGDGSLRAADFFAPYDRSTLDVADTDFGSGGPVALPAAFGTAAFPRLLMAGGKTGIIYLLDRDRLGGMGQGSGGGDAVVSTVTAAGGMWSRPAVWPGEGGYIYVVANSQPLQALRFGQGGDGRPLFSEAGRGENVLGYTSGSPIVTSDGARPGSALVWLTKTSSTYAEGVLHAYDAVPDATGRLRLRFEDGYGTHAKFSVPGVGNGRIYVGTADGHVLGYGAPVHPPLEAATVAFGAVTVGTTAARTAVLTAKQDVTVTGSRVSGAMFATGPATPPLPAVLPVGATLSIPVSFAPAEARLYAASLELDTTLGPATVMLEGRGEAAAAMLSAQPRMVSFGGLARGRSKVLNVVLANTGAQPLTWQGFTAPDGPFAASNLPPVGATLAGGAQVTISLAFAPTAVGSYSGQLVVRSTGGEATVFMAGAAGEPPLLWIMPTTLDFGAVAPGATVTRSFSVRNGGGSDLMISKSKPPALGVFVAGAALDEGTVIGPGVARALTVSFSPTSAGSFSDQWLITGDDGGGMQVVSFTGSAVAAPADAGAPDAGAVVSGRELRRRALAPLVAPAITTPGAGSRPRTLNQPGASSPSPSWGGTPWPPVNPPPPR
jgi:hypothetical protein